MNLARLVVSPRWFLRQALGDPRVSLVLAVCLLDWCAVRIAMPLTLTGAGTSTTALVAELTCIASLAGTLYGLERSGSYQAMLWSLSSVESSSLFALWIGACALLPGYLTCLIPAWLGRPDPQLLWTLVLLPWLVAVPFTAVALILMRLDFSRSARALTMIGTTCVLPAAIPGLSLVPGPRSIEHLFESASIESLGTRILPFVAPIMASAMLFALLPRSRPVRPSHT